MNKIIMAELLADLFEGKKEVALESIRVYEILMYLHKEDKLFDGISEDKAEQLVTTLSDFCLSEQGKKVPESNQIDVLRSMAHSFKLGAEVV